MWFSELDWAYIEERAAQFTGRAWVFERLDAFLRGPPGVFLLVGAPGTGKTAVAAQLARAAAGRLTNTRTVDALAPVSIDAAHFCRARQADVLDVAQRLSAQLAHAIPAFAQTLHAGLAREVQFGEVHVHTGDVASHGSVTGVRIDLGKLEAESAFMQGVTLPLKRLREAGDMTRVVLLIDALDECLASKAAFELPRLLSGVEHAHLVVTSRRDTRAIHWLRDWAQLVDLVVDAPPGSDDVLTYVKHRLTPQGAPDAMRVLAERIAEQAEANFLYAFYVVEALLRAGGLSRLDGVGARRVPLPRGGLPSLYRDFLRRELGRDEHAWSDRFGPILALLAVAHEEGLHTGQLEFVASRLSGRPVSRTAVREVTRKASQFLDGPPPDGPFRMYHQSFADFLVDPRQNRDFLVDSRETHKALVDAYMSTDPLTWDRYARRNLPLHALGVDRLDGLLTNPRVLIAAEPDRLLHVLRSARQPDARLAARVYERAAHQLRSRPAGERAACLALAAKCTGAQTLAARLSDVEPQSSWWPVWAHWQSPGAYRLLGRHNEAVYAVAIGVLDEQPVVISGGGGVWGRHDYSVRVWDLATGTPLYPPLQGHTNSVHALAVSSLSDRPVIISGGADHTVRVWDLATGEPVRAPYQGHTEWVTALAASRLRGRQVMISGGHDHTVQVWDLASGTPLYPALEGHTEWVTGVLVAGLGKRRVIVSSDWGGTVRVWDLATGAPVGATAPYQGYGSIQTIAVGRLGQRSVVVCGGESYDNGFVRMLDLATGSSVGTPLRDEEGIQAVAVGTVGKRSVVVSGGGSLHDGMIRISDLASGAPLGMRVRGHDNVVFALAITALRKRSVAISGSSDGTIRAWDLADLISSPPMRTSGHQTVVEAVSVGRLSGKPVLVSGGNDGTVWVWDLSSGALVRGPLRHSDEYAVTALAVGDRGDRPVIVSGGGDGSLRVWDLRTGALMVDLPEIDLGWITSIAVGRLGDRPVVAFGETLGSVQVWDLTSGAHIRTLRDEENSAPCVAIGRLGKRRVVACGDSNGTIEVWDLASGALVRAQSWSHENAIWSVAIGALGGQAVLVSGSSDHTVRVWDLAAGTSIITPLRGHQDTVTAVGLFGEGKAVISGAKDGTMRVWNMATGHHLIIDVGAQVLDLATAPGELAAAACSMGLLVLKIRPGSAAGPNTLKNRI